MVVLVLGGILVTRFVTTSRDMVTAGQSSDGTDGSGGSGDDADGSGSGSGTDGGSGGTDTDPDASGSGSDRDSRSGGSGSGVGDCIVKQAEPGEFIQNLDIPEVVDCDDPRAAFEVLHVRRDASGQRCVDVKGATDAVSYTTGPVEAFCLAKVGEDQSRNINGIEVGECAEVVAEFMYRTECGAPGSYRVLAVYDDPGPLPAQFDGPITPCVNHGAPNATMVFQWGVADKPEIREGEFQRGICLIEAG